MIGNPILSRMLGVSGWPYPYDNFESYTDAADLSGLNGGYSWNGNYRSVDSLFGIKSNEDFESYTDTINLAGLNGSSNLWNGIYIVGKLSSPTISPTYQPTLPATFSLSSTNATCSIYYTIDSSTPTTNSLLYSTPFILSNTASINVFAAQSGYTNSPSASATYPSTPHEPETLDWISRVQGQGSDVNSTSANAIDSFAVGLKTNNLLGKAYRVGVYLGNDLNSLKAPFINVSGSVTDNLVGFVSGDYTNNGLIGGSGKSIRTGFVPTAISPSISSSLSIGFYIRTTTAAPAYYDIGSYNGTQYVYILTNVPSTYWSCWNNFAQVNATTAYTGSFMGNRNGTTTTLYRNGASIASGTDAVTTMPAYDIWVHALNGAGSDPGSNSTRQFCFYWIGKSLTAGEHSTLYTLIQNLQISCSRQV